MTFGHQTAMSLLHIGGVAEVINTNREIANRIILRLTTCTEHGASHVFVVDQSDGDRVNIGMSEHGMRCIDAILRIFDQDDEIRRAL